MQFIQDQEDVYLKLLINLTNGGLVTSSQDTQITVYALSKYPEISKVLDEYEDDYSSEFISVPDASMRKLERKPSELPAMKIVYEVKPEEKKTDKQSNEIDILDEEEKPVEDEKLEMVEVDQSDLLDNTLAKPEDLTEIEQLKKKLEKIASNKHTIECIDKNFPAKKLTPQEIECKNVDKNGQHFLYGKSWRRDPGGGLELIDKELCERQKKVLTHFLKNMGKNLLEGKSIMNVSLPITIFSCDSILQRAVEMFGYAPYYLKRAGEQQDRLEAFKNVLTFFFTMTHLGLSQEKPFNPILGNSPLIPY